MGRIILKVFGVKNSDWLLCGTYSLGNGTRFQMMPDCNIMSICPNEDSQKRFSAEISVRLYQNLSIYPTVWLNRITGASLARLNTDSLPSRLLYNGSPGAQRNCTPASKALKYFTRAVLPSAKIRWYCNVPAASLFSCCTHVSRLKRFSHSFS